jgi:hypothetical protein
MFSVSAFDIQATNKKIIVLQNEMKEKLDYDVFDNQIENIVLVLTDALRQVNHSGA